MAVNGLSFAFDTSKGETPQSVARKRAIIAQIMGSQRAPQNVGEGLNALGSGIVANVLNRRADRAEAAGNQSWQPAWQAVIDPMGQGGFPAAPAPIGGAAPMAAKPTMGDVATNRVAQGHAGGGMTAYRDAIASIESAGSGDYAAVGPTHPKLGRALGRYQVMEANIGPWSEKHLGRRVSADEFMANPALQDAIFDGEFGTYVNKFGPEGAAQAWFGGPGGVGKVGRKDSLGTSIGAYGQKFNKAMGGASAANEAMASGQMAGMQPTALAPIETRATEPMAAPQAPQMAPMLPEPRAIQDRPIQVAQADGGFPMQEMAGRNPQALQGGPDMQKLMELSANPWLPDHQRAWVNAALQQQMQQNDPMYQLQVQQLRRELAAPPKRDTTTINGRLVDAQTGEQIAQFDDPADPTTAIQEFEYARQRGYEGDFVQFQLDQKKAGATSITTNVGEGSKFYDELDKAQAGTFGALAETGVQARSKMAQIDRLEGLLTQAETGGLAMIKQAAGEYGIATEGLSDIQAAQALINELVPQQRQPGSGPMSDADLALFKQSLPRLINQPGGNQTIINTMRGITQYQIQMGEIADAVADRKLTPAQAREQIRNLPNPLAGITAQENRQRNRTSSGVEWSIEE